MERLDDNEKQSENVWATLITQQMFQHSAPFNDLARESDTKWILRCSKFTMVVIVGPISAPKFLESLEIGWMLCGSTARHPVSFGWVGARRRCIIMSVTAHGAFLAW